MLYRTEWQVATAGSPILETPTEARTLNLRLHHRLRRGFPGTWLSPFVAAAEMLQRLQDADRLSQADSPVQLTVCLGEDATAAAAKVWVLEA